MTEQRNNFIRSHKGNELFKNGLAYNKETDEIIYSSVYNNDIYKTREQIENEYKGYNAYQLKLINAAAERENNSSDIVARDYEVTSKSKRRNLLIKLDLYLFGAFASLVAGVYSNFQSFYELVVCSAIVGATSFAFYIKQSAVVENFEKDRKHALYKATLPPIEKVISIEELKLKEQKELENKIKDELDTKIVIDHIKRKPIEEVYHMLGPTLLEKLEEQKISMPSMQKTMNNQK